MNFKLGFIIAAINAAPAIASRPCEDICHQRVGPASYCKMDNFPHVCHGSEVRCCNEDASGHGSSSALPQSRRFDPSFFESITEDMNRFCRTHFGGRSSCLTDRSPPVCEGTTQECTVIAAGAFAARASSPLASSSGCRAKPSVSTPPMFLWVEGTVLDSFAEFETFYSRLADFVTGNRANMDTVRLIIRVAHPLVHAAGDSTPIYWPPRTSPILTVLDRRLKSLSKRVSIIFYPNIWGNTDRALWVEFAQSRRLNPRSNLKVTDDNVYDGIYSFVHGWQEFVDSQTSSISIEGYTIDYEEIKPHKDRGKKNIVLFTSKDLRPYKRAYPSIRSGISLAYDDRPLIDMFANHIDNLFVQVYDLYYPIKHADKSPETSIFERYNSRPSRLAEVILEEVLTPSIQSIYAPYLDRIFLMWSTQYTPERRCLYPVGDERTCGINYEIHSTPENFNTFINQVARSSEILSRVQHGIYTFNFLQQSWMPTS